MQEPSEREQEEQALCPGAPPRVQSVPKSSCLRSKAESITWMAPFQRPCTLAGNTGDRMARLPSP